MGIKSHILEALNSFFKHFGYELVNDQWKTLYKPDPQTEPEPQDRPYCLQAHPSTW